MVNSETFKNISTGVAAIAAAIIIPVAVALISSGYSDAQKEREIQGRYIEIAIRILSKEPKEPQKGIRKWAVQIIDKYSEVPLSGEAQNDLIGEEKLDFSVTKEGDLFFKRGDLRVSSHSIPWQYNAPCALPKEERERFCEAVNKASKIKEERRKKRLK